MMDMNWIRGLMTVAWLLAFVGIVWWAYHPSTRARFDAAERLPFDDDMNADKTPSIASTVAMDADENQPAAIANSRTTSDHLREPLQ